MKITRRLAAIVALDLLIGVPSAVYFFGPALYGPARAAAVVACESLDPPGWSAERSVSWQVGLPSGYVCTPAAFSYVSADATNATFVHRLGWLPRG